MQDDFYIGWREDNPSGFKKFSRKFWLGVVAVFLLFAVVFTFQQRGFISSYFEFGSLTEISGTLIEYPVYAIITEEEGENQTVPLVGFGKFGPDATIAAWREEHPKLGHGSQVIVRGTRFRY